MGKLLKNKNILTIMISCIIVVILFASSSFFRVLNKSIQNEYYSIKNSIVGLQANPHIVIVEIDDKSFEAVGTFPFPRSSYARLLENLQPYNVATVAFDVLFLDPSRAEEDNIFKKSIEDFQDIVLGSSLNNKGIVQTPFIAQTGENYKTGYLPPNIESSNNTVYSFTPSIIDEKNRVYEHFTLQILRSFYEYLYDDSDIGNIGNYKPGEYIFSEDISYPLAGKGRDEILINFIPPENFTRISFADVYDKDALEKISKDIALQDTIVLIGPAADGLKDEFFTPNGIEYGVNIHANILNTLLSKKHMMYFDKHLEWVLIFFLVILSVSANLSSSNRVLLFSNVAIVAVFWFVFPLSILLGTNLILNYPSEIIFSLILAFTSANIVKYLIEDLNKKKLNRALSEYVGVNIADEILLEHGKVNLDGQEKELVCFFSDIEGFTSLSEKLSPGELVGFLREYLSEMTSIIMDHSGHVDKFEGDAVMALWGAFTKHDDMDYLKACKSALRQQKSLNKLNETWNKKLGGNIKTRMGIHGGKAIVGNIGAVGRKMEFTALGDDVNLASRLEGVNKFYGTYICVSEAVYLVAKKDFVFRYLDKIQVKGKDIPVKIYELISERGDTSQEQQEIYDVFLGAIQLYKHKDFIKALEIFKKLELEGDAPSKTYINRCEAYIKTPPGEDWDGVYRMTEK